MRAGRANTLKPLSRLRIEKTVFKHSGRAAKPSSPHTSSSSACQVINAYFFNMTKMIKMILPAKKKKKKRRAAAGLRSERFRRSSSREISARRFGNIK